MATDRSYADYIVELLAPIGDISSRAMFGGFGIRHGDDNFALITSASVLEFEVDDASRAKYEATESEQFMRMPYWSAPADVLEDETRRLVWAREAIDVGHRTAKTKKATTKKATAKKVIVKKTSAKTATTKKAATKTAKKA